MHLVGIFLEWFQNKIRNVEMVVLELFLNKVRKAALEKLLMLALEQF